MTLGAPSTRRKLVYCNHPLWLGHWDLWQKKCIKKSFWLATGGFWLPIVQKPHSKTSSWSPKWFIYAFSCLEWQWMVVTDKLSFIVSCERTIGRVHFHLVNVAFILTLDAKVVLDLTSKLVTLINNDQLLCGLKSRGTTW